MNTSQLMAGLDIGSTKVCALIAKSSADRPLEVLGLGVSPSLGVKRGTVVDLEDAADSVLASIEEAEKAAGLQVNRITLGVSGMQVEGITGRAVLALPGEGQVRRRDVDRAVALARRAIPQDRDLLHEVPQGFRVGNKKPVLDPVGMTGNRLEAEVHFFTGMPGALQNIARCARLSGFEVGELVLQAIASAEAVLDETDKENGTLVVDIGGGTTNWIVYCGGFARRAGALPIGGQHVTRDLAAGFQVTEAAAEEFKRRACIDPDMPYEKLKRSIVPDGAGARPPGISARLLCDIVRLRVEEIFELLVKRLRREGLSELVSGVVLTGGSSLFDGVTELVYSVFRVPARLGQPMIEIPGCRTEAARLSTAVGLVRYGLRETIAQASGKLAPKRMVSGVSSRMRTWFDELLGPQS